MKKQNYTPGPLTAINALVYSGTTCIANCSLEHLKIAARFEYYSGDKQTEQDRDVYLKERFKLDELEKENAKLFAAAPNLLDAVQYAIECLQKLDNLGDYGDQALQALEKAIKDIEQ